MTIRPAERSRPPTGVRPRLGWCALLALALQSCGGGMETGGTGATVPPSSVVQGRINGFGSILVARIHVDETKGTIVDGDDRPLDAGALALGRWTTIDAGPVETVQVGTTTRQVAQATRIRVHERLLGEVTARDAATCTLTVLQQAVDVRADTVLDGVAAPAGACRVGALPLGTVVAVHGSRDVAAGHVVASRIERADGAAGHVLQAPLERYDAAAARATVGGVALDLSSIPASQRPAALALGDEVRAVLAPRAADDGRRRVLSLRAAGVVLQAAGARVQLEGRVTAFTSAQRFAVDGVAVDASGITASGGAVALGAKVDLEGTALPGGVVRATKVEVEVESGDVEGGEPVEIEGRVTALDRAARTIVVRGTTIDYGSASTWEGSAASLAVGVKVAIVGMLSVDGTRVVARKVHVED